jgi:hypothetical protein
MLFDKSTKSLLTDDGRFIKRLYCPKELDLKDLKPIAGSVGVRHCGACNERVQDLSAISESELVSLVESNPALCVFADESARVRVVQTENGKSDARTYGVSSADQKIYTVRALDEISRLSRAGVRLLIKPVVYSDEIKDQASLWRHRETRELEVHTHDRRRSPDDLVNLELVIPTYYYRTYPQGPLAAYIIPTDLSVGARVTLEDVIDDLVLIGSEYTDGVATRREKAAAIWTGDDFEVQPYFGYMRSLG